jgi:hypothetical protein|tara:strand:+ start:818 stop:1111 length:294 start_codon:yes stop_codon:yes gene_type:complete
LEAFVSVGAWKSILDIELELSLPELIHIVDMSRFRRHNDYDLLARVVTGEGLGEYDSMTDLEDLGGGSGSSADLDLDSEFTITHLPIGLGYESVDVG